MSHKVITVVGSLSDLIDRDEVEFPTIQDALTESCIVSFNINKERQVEISEVCDCYSSVILTKEQFKAFIDELTEIYKNI